MASSSLRAPGVPADYYRRIFDVEQSHFWYSGMQKITASLLGDRLTRPGLRLLDAGCGTGGFLRWTLDNTPTASVFGIDIGSDAIDFARRRVPEADLRTGPLCSLPFADACFDVVVTNDVLQHVSETEVQPSLRELSRVLTPTGTLLVHTNGSRHLRRERDDWRAYDRASLVREVENAGFVCERSTYASLPLSLWSASRGRYPHAPSETSDGIPKGVPSLFVSTIGRWLFAAEARWLASPRRSLPYGHTLFAVARKPVEARK
jgi:SAM-dependent methyltransferase